MRQPYISLTGVNSKYRIQDVDVGQTISGSGSTQATYVCGTGCTGYYDPQKS